MGGNVVAAARRLPLSERAVRNRRRAVERLTGLVLTDSTDVARIRLALLLWRRHRADLPPLSDPAWQTDD